MLSRFQSAVVGFLAIGLSPTLALSAVPTTAPPRPPPTAPPAPAIEAGSVVYDRSGLDAGVVQSLVETPAGPMIVARIDGKLISLPQKTLTLRDGRLVSDQTKDQMMDAAGAPR